MTPQLIITAVFALLVTAYIAVLVTRTVRMERKLRAAEAAHLAARRSGRFF